MRTTFLRLGCGKQMKTKGKRPEGIVFTNADPRYAGKLDDPQGGEATMLKLGMEQRRGHQIWNGAKTRTPRRSATG